METLNADVWVVGSGAAGLMAAIAAAQAGAGVRVLGKEAPGRGTATERSGGAFAGAWEGLSVEEQRARTFTAGRGINRADLVDVLAADGPARFRDLVDWGMPHRTTPGALRASRTGDDEIGAPPLWGIEIVRTLEARARTLGVQFLDETVITDIRAGEDGVRLAAYRAGGEGTVALSGGAAILAAGGAAGLYQHHDNPPRAIGDSYALALGAGAELQDMEFVQFYPITLAEPGKTRILLEPDEADQGIIQNDKGENILEKYGITERPAARHARDGLSQALFREMELDGATITIDLTHLGEADWAAHSLSEIRRAYLAQWYDAFNRPLRISPVAHFMVGGTCIDTDGTTTVAGLYAAGEAAGGLHGANRMGGNSLAETVVFGHRAGQAAAAFAQGRDQGRAVHGNATPPPEPGRTDSAALLEDLRRVMWRHAGIERDAAGLDTGLARIQEIQAAKPGSARELEAIGDTLELRLATQTAELIVQTAARREESRGAHFRTDFPETDDAMWLGNAKVARRDGRLEWRFDEVRDETG